MTYIKDLSDVGPGDLALAGGKAVGLGGLLQAGLPVPPGFVLTTAAYTAFVTHNNLGAAIQDLATLPPQPDPQAYDDASARISALFKTGAMPAGIAADLGAAYSHLAGGDTAVAVRSSATAEDLASASFAGQQDTALNVRGTDALTHAVIGCWASLWTARAMAYRAREGVRPDQVRLAVVIQDMVEADAAGVMFTANPANGRRDQTAISAAWGLGESVVSGTVTTDDLVVDAGTGAVVSRRTADKDVMTVYAENGTREQPVAAARRRAPVLDDRAAAELAGYGTRAAGHFGAPQDIEWARAGGRFYILQSRPITALPDPAADTPDTWPLPYPKGLYFRASIVEQMPDPLSPLFADLIDGSVARSLQALMNEALGKTILRDGDVRMPTINGYAYYYYRTSGMLRMVGKTVTAVGALARGKAHMGVAGWREFSHPRYERVIKDWQAKPPAGAHRRGTAGRRPGAAGRRHRLLHGRAVHHPAGRLQRTGLQRVLRQTGPARRGSPRPGVPPRVRQRTDPGGKIAVGPGRLGPQRSCADNGAGGTSDGGTRRVPAHRFAARRGGHRPVAGMALRLPGAPGPLRPRRLQPGLRQPGAGRRSVRPAGDGEVLPAGAGHRPA